MSVCGWPVSRSSGVPLLRALLCFALAAGVAAEEEASPGAEQVADEAEQRIDPDATPASEADDAPASKADDIPDGESPDTFVPSEDISENIAVKFPVDI